MLFSHLFCRNNLATKICELNKFKLDRLQPFVPLSVSDLRICSISSCPAETVHLTFERQRSLPEDAQSCPEDLLDDAYHQDNLFGHLPSWLHQTGLAGRAKQYRSEGLVNFDQSLFPNNVILKMEDCCPRERIST